MIRVPIGPSRAAVAIACISALLGCRRAAEPVAPPPEEEVVPVGGVLAERAGIRAVVQASGVVVPAEGGEFLAVAPEPARIVEVTKQEGDAVQSGEVLVRFELSGAAQDVNRAAADLAAAQARLENATINQSRARDFVERGLVARRELETADRELTDARAVVDRLARAHAAAVTAAGRAIVRAPFDGIVATRWHNPGDLVLSSTADPVLRVVDPRRLDVAASVAETDVSRVVPGATARVAGPADAEPIRLSVTRRLADRIGPDGTLPFQLVFAEPTELAVDTRVEVEIDAEERADAVLVPAEAVLQDGGQAIVMVAAGGRAERRVVTTGIQDLARVEITSGVKPGEMVITRGQVGLADGAAVSVATEAR